MTAQESDIFILNDKEYDISGVNGNELFIPGKYGLMPVSIMTCNWRGYVATYALLDDILVLKSFSVNLKEDNTFDKTADPLINEHVPEKDHIYDDIYSYFYENLNLPINFTGGILACQGFIPELYVHMGFHPAWKFEKVIELLFDNGKLTERHDVSKKMKVFRDEMIKKGLRPDYREIDLSEWINSCFQLDYQL